MAGASDGKRDFFISFNQADRTWATWIAWLLEEAGYSVFFQDWDFQGNFVLEMDRAHQHSRRTIAVLSPDYLTSRFTAPEWAARFAEDATSAFDLLVPVRVRSCELGGLLAQIVYVDLIDCDEARVKQCLLERVHGLRRKPEEPPIFPGAPRHETLTERPIFPVPHNLPQPNRGFVGRAAELAALEQALAGTDRTAITQPQAIIGLGGIGKTQLALHYCYSHLVDYDLICWLPAEEPATLAVAYTGLASALGLDPATPDQPALIAAIRAKLERTAGWLLVFDNATAPATLDHYLPRTGAGHILITSRHQDWADAAAMIELDFLPEDQAVLLLGADADDPVRWQDAAALARDLGFLPLALVQARAFMRARKVDIAGYQHQLAAARPKVLAWRRPDVSYPLSVAQTWQVSMMAAAEDCPAARELLELLAFLGPEAIPRTLLGAEPATLPEVLRDPFDRDSAIEALHRFSLLRADHGGLTVHRLIQAVTRDGLEEATATARAETVVRLVNVAFPDKPQDPRNWPPIGILLPHTLAAAEAAERFGTDLELVAWVVNGIGIYHQERATFAEAAPLYQRALAIREKALGPDHPDTATSLNSLAGLYQDQGQLDEAVPLYQRALAITEKVLGPDHPDTATSLNNLASLYRDQGQLDEAAPLYQRALAIWEKVLGLDHPDTAASLNNLALLYRDQGQLDEAAPLLQRALVIWEKVLGPDHPNTATSLNNLASLYQDEGQLGEAVPLYQRALTITEKVLGPDHPDTAASLNNLASLYQDQGQLDEAAPLYQRALAITEKMLGPDHPKTCVIRENLVTLQ